MKRWTAAIALFAMLNLFAAAAAFQGTVDLNGTWEGTTWVSGPEFELTMTLVLQQKGSEISGKLNDDMGYINCEITEPILKQSTLTFKAVANTPDGDIGLNFEVTVAGNKMEGKWESDDGLSGTWTAEKQ